MKLSTKLYATIGSLALVGMIAAVTGIWYLRMLGEELNTATGQTAMKLDLVNASRARAWEMVASLRGMFLFASLKNRAGLESSASRVGSAYKRIGEQIAELRPLLVTEQARRDLDRFDAGIRQFERIAADYSRFCRENELAKVATLIPALQEFTNTSDTTLNSVKDQVRQTLKESQNRSASLQSQSLSITLSVGALLLVFASIAILTVVRVNRTLATVTYDLSEGAAQVAAAAGQVSSASQSLAQGSSEQAATLEETSASAEEINSMSRKNSENSSAAAGLMTNTQQRFVETNQLLEHMLSAIGDINTQSGKIAKIIKVIDEIAFQTNILALNAAVEAARAGEAGMGFAVVADEVRNLAQRCAQAARDTTGLIEESIQKSRHGKVKVDQVAAAIRDITGEAEQVRTLVEEVNLGSLEQASGIEQIGKAIIQMEQVTQSTAANAEEGAAAAEQLNAQSAALKDIVSQLSQMVGGGQASSGTRTGTRQVNAPARLSSGLKALRKAVSRQAGSPVRDSAQEIMALEEELTKF